MNYIVLARKYRPQTFAEVYAQEHITEVLQNAILSKRIAHAYLFTGPRGVGKTSMARILAKSLNCVEGPTITPCNKCHNCVEIASGISADVIEIDGASNTGVDDIRELQRELLYAPSQSPYKIYIIDEVHMLSKNAFNALLKTLEEPPDNVIFIFATTEPYKVLPTIISRCQRYDFKRIPIDAIVKRVGEIMQEENIEIDAESLHLIARKADGSLRDALSLADQVLSYCGNKVTIDKVRDIFGLIPTQIYCNIMKLLHSKNNAGLLQQLQHIFEGGADLQEFINNLLEFLRIVLLRKIGMSPEEVTSEEYPAYDEIASLFSQENLLYMMSMLMQTRTELKSSGNPYLIFELAMIKLCKLDKMEDLGEVIARLKSQPLTKVVPQTPKQPVSKGVTTPVNIESKPDIITSVEPEPIDKKELTQENLTELWDKIVARVIQIGRMAGLALKEANFKVSSGFKIIIQLSRKSSLDAVQGKKEDIEQIIGEYFQTQPRLELELISGNTVDSIVIPHKTLEDLKKMDENLARYIEITDSKLIS